MGTGTRNAQRLAKKLEDRGFLHKSGKARATRYHLDWCIEATVAQEAATCLDARKSKLDLRHADEHRRIQRPLSGEELEVRRRVRNTCQWAKPYFDEALEAEGEQKAALEKVGHLIAGAKEADWRRRFDAGRSLTDEEVAELAPKRPKPTPEEQEAIKARLAKLRSRVAVSAQVGVEPEVPGVDWEPEEAAQERELLAKVKGDGRLFEVMYGRKTWTSRVVDPREAVRHERHQRLVAPRRERMAV